MKLERKQAVLIASLVLIILGGAVMLTSPHLPEWAKPLSALGAPFLTIGAVTLVWERVTVAVLVGEVTDALAGPLDGLRTLRHGIRTVAVGSFYRDVFDAMASSDEFIMVQTWSPDLANFLKEAKGMARRGGVARFYLLDPDSAAARQRSCDLGNSPEVVPAEIRTDTLRIRSAHAQMVAEGTPGHLELYYYDSLPAFALYQVNTRAWMGFYWHGTQSDRGTTLVIDKPSMFWRECQDHLEKLARKAHRVDLEGQSP